MLARLSHRLGGLALCLLLAACGRIDFELLPRDAGGDASSDAGMRDSGVEDASADAAPDSGQPIPAWTRFFQSDARANPRGLGVDTSGNVYLGGAYEGSVTVDPDGSLPNVSPISGFVASYSARGELRWEHGYGGSKFLDFRHLAALPDGTSYAAGLLNQQASIGGTQYDAGSTQNVIVVAHDAAGGVESVELYEGVNFNAQGRAIDVSSAGVAVAGVYGGNIDFGGGSLGPADMEHGFAAVFDPGGSHVWSRPYAGSGFLFGDGAAIDDSGRTCFAGRFDVPTDLGGGSVSPAGGSDIWVASYDADGSFRWGHGLGGSQTDKARTATLVDGGDCVTVGQLQGSGEFGEAGTVQGQGGQDAVVVRIASSGEVQWARSLGGSGNDAAQAVTADAAGNIYVTGSFEGEGEFAGRTRTSNGGRDAFVVALDPSGDALWARALGGAGDEGGFAIAHDPRDGAVVVAGDFEGQTDIGGVSASGTNDGFVHRFVP
jgi:hypothetical protein